MKHTFSTVRKAILMVYGCDSRAFWVRLICMLVQSILPLVNIYLLKQVVDGITLAVASQSNVIYETPVWTSILLFCAVFFANRLVGVVNGVNNDKLSQKITDYLSERIQRQSSLLDMAYYDTPEFYDTFHRAQQEASTRPISIFNNTVTLIGSLISIVGIAFMLADASFTVLLVMIAAVIPSFVFRLKKAIAVYKFRRNSTQDYRKTSYFAALLSNREYAKEVRTYNLSEYFRSRFVKLRKGLVDRLLSISKKMAVLDGASAIIETVALLAVLFLLLNKAIVGAITVGSFVMLFEAYRRGQSYLQKTVVSVSSLYDNRLFMDNLNEFLELKPQLTSPQSPVPFPDRIEKVTFNHVFFSYPNSDKFVLSDFCLEAGNGEVALVQGENGFGKTTMLKLLLRLYDPLQGSIEINGIDIRQFDVNELRRSVGAIFQDYVRFYCTVSDNIVFGDVGNPDKDKIAKAASMAGIHELIEKMPEGYETQLGRMFVNGEELSMGQWQKLALARLYYSDAPVLILDEPTAWMDAPSRQHFYQQLESLKANKVIILINHI